MKKLLITLIAVFTALNCYAGTTETSGITAYTIQTRAERYLDVSDDPLFTDNDFIQWVDEAIRETINRTGCTQTTPITVTLSANTSRYSLGQSFLMVTAVEHDNGDTTDKSQVITLDRVHPNDLRGHNKETGRPKFYSVWNNLLEIWPIPRTDHASTSLYVYTVPLPTGISATSSSVETPAYFDVALLYYTVAMGLFKNDRFEEGNVFLKLYEQRIEEYNTLVLRKTPIE